ncbi:MAG: redox-regulated ATPase YchF [Desulfurococcaceae archaeon]|nr:redox-regulated ATPase YchF [Desulfurococcaceae archaeon]
MPVLEKIIGVVGKTNVGKSTLFSAMTMIPVKIADHPFTTIEPNVGVAYVKKRCVHVELGLSNCNPRSGFCVKGFRFIPVKVMDVAGLVPGAHRGRGLGNKFMDDLRQADVLIHVVDAAGSTDLDGNRVKPGTADPVEEAKSILFEINEWFKNVITRIWENKISRTIITAQNPVEVIYQNISGLNVKRAHVIEAIRRAGLESKHPKNWNTSDVVEFSFKLREVSKPIIIAANKVDFPEAKDNVKRLMEEFSGENIVPVSALAELIIRKASQAGLIEYTPGDADFEIKNPAALTREQLKVLEMIRDNVLKPYGSTGVQELLRRAVFDKLKLIAVYPVADESRMSDHSGNVLPDAYLVERGTTVRELAYLIHTALGDGFLYAIDAKRRRRVGESHILEDDDVVKIVSTLSR